ncbi:MAG: CoA transferase [Chloroflexi bacterium]|nr:CoA transferase [Chloroflexota bacterium]
MGGAGNLQNRDRVLARQDGVRHPSALSDIRVLDLADQKGVYCTKLLADLGADVIKVEPPEGDPTRNIGPFFHDERHPERSLYFFLYNTSKRSITLDLRTRAGQNSFRGLVKTSDVVVETFLPGYLEGMGLGYESLRRLNPGLVMTSVTGFGQTGPWKNYKSCDIVGMATGGLLLKCGWPDLPPQRMAGSQAYFMASVQAAAGTLMALYQRPATGEGQHVDVSVQASVPVSMQTVIQIFEKTGRIRQRAGNSPVRDNRSADTVFPCKDGYVDIGQLTGISSWERLVNWLDSGEAAGDLKEEKYQDPFYRVKPEVVDHINGLLVAFLLQHTKAEVFHTGQQKGVVIGPVNTPEDIVDDPQLRLRNFFVPVAHPELGANLRYPGAPYRLSETPWVISRRPPRLGEHNSEILEQEIGLRGAVAAGFSLRRSAPVKGAATAPPLPLAGIRVAEFAEHVAGPMVGKALADYGAQVIIVENQERARKGSTSRHPGTGAANLSSLNVSHHFNKFYMNKLSLTLDLTKPKGVEIARRLIGKSDVVITNFMPRVLDRWGFSYAALREIRPDIIFLTMPAFGAEGPYRDYRTLSWNLMAMCGLDQASGFPDRPPIRASPWSHPDTSCQPFHALIALLAALRWRTRTGKGQHIEVCQYESTLYLAETLVFDYLVNKRLPKPQGNRLDYAAPHGVYRCLGDDRWCAIAVFDEAEWQGFCRVIGRPDLIADERFSTLADRLANADLLDSVTTEWTEKRSPWEVMELMQKAGVAAGVVENEEDLLLRDPQLKARSHWISVDHPEAGKLTVEDWGFKLSAVPARNWRHAPLLGEHNDLVLTGILGMSESEVNQLIIDGIVA